MRGLHITNKRGIDLRRILALFFALVLCLLCGCSKEDVSSQTVGLDKESVEISVGESCKLTLLGGIEPEWSSADEEIARVFYGVVTGIAVGETTVTAVSQGKSYNCAVKVVEGAVKDESQNKDDVSSVKGESKDKAETKPTVSSDKDVSSKQEEDEKAPVSSDEYLKERIHKDIDEEYDKLISDFSAECDEAISEAEGNVNAKKREIEEMNKEKPGLGDKVYADQLAELEAELERLKKIKADGIATYNRMRAEDKKNWRDRVATIKDGFVHVE